MPSESKETFQRVFREFSTKPSIAIISHSAAYQSFRSIHSHKKGNWILNQLAELARCCLSPHSNFTHTIFSWDTQQAIQCHTLIPKVEANGSKLLFLTGHRGMSVTPAFGKSFQGERLYESSTFFMLGSFASYQGSFCHCKIFLDFWSSCL